MLFNSFEFIGVFLPVTFLVYFWLGRLGRVRAAQGWLLAASLFFYAWWDPRALPLILASIAANCSIGAWISRLDGRKAARRVMIAGITLNLLLLAVYKYADFILGITNGLIGTKFPPLGITLPLGISFFTFTQIAYLADAYQGKAKDVKPVHYALFVAFFPHLLAGPIVHHGQVMPQFDRKENAAVQYPNLFIGLFYFLTGLFQKLVFADFAGPIADAGFLHASGATLLEAWAALLAYTLQIYFDFAGYSNMAIGLALFFNIRFPVNFNSPYQAASIVDFWKRWHMTLSAFLRDYLYIPLGGNKRSRVRRYTNIFLTMFLGGIWHGAGWTFVIWGAYHGALIVLNHMAREARIGLPRVLAWPLTFLAVSFGWVFFRAADLEEALQMTRALAGSNGLRLTDLPFLRPSDLAVLAGMLAIVLFWPNTESWAKKVRPGLAWLAVFAAAWMTNLLMLNRSGAFLYFQF